MKRRMKNSWIAIFCTMLLLPWNVLLLKAGPAVTAPQSLTKWDITTVGIPEHLKVSPMNKDVAGKSTGQNLDGKAFYTSIRFAEVASDVTGRQCLRLAFGKEADSNSFALDAIAGGNLRFAYTATWEQSFVITPESVGCTGSLVGAPLDLIITTEFKNNNGTTTDVNVGLYINGNLYNNDYIVMKNIPLTMLEQNVFIHNWGNPTEDIHIGIPGTDVRGPHAGPVTAPGKLKEWTIQDVGLSVGECNADRHSVEGVATGDTLDGKALTTMIKFGDNLEDLTDNAYLRVNIGTSQTSSFILDAVPGGFLKFFYYDNGQVKGTTLLLPEKIDGKQLVGRLMKLTVTTEFMNLSADGTRTDVNVGIYIDDVLYKNRYITVRDVAVSSLQQNFRMDNWGAVKETIKIRDPYVTVYPEIKDELSGADFGFGGVTIKNKSMVGTLDNQALSQTAITTNINISSATDNAIYFGGKKCGIRLQPKGKDVAVAYVNSAGKVKEVGVLSAKTAGVSSLTDKRLEWRITFQMCEMTENQGALKLGIYVNGKQYGGKFFEINDVKFSEMKRIISVSAKKGTVRFSEMDYQELQFEDFSIRDTSLTNDDLTKGVYQKYNLHDKETLENTAVSGIIKFPKAGGVILTLGGTDWQGINFQSRNNGTIDVLYSYTNGSVKLLGTLHPDKAGVDAFWGKEFNLRVTFDIFQTSSEKADVRLGIYINGKLYDGKYIAAADLELAQLTRTCFIYSTSAWFSIKSVPEDIDLSIYGVDDAWEKKLGIK